MRTTSDDSGSVYQNTEIEMRPTNNWAQFSTSGVTSFFIGQLSSGGQSGSGMTMEFLNPNLATATIINNFGATYQSNTGNYVLRETKCVVRTTTQYTGFSIIGTTDNLSGTVRVYGYRK
jgi:hypothetical protein